MKRGAAGSLLVVGILALLVAGAFFGFTPVIKFSGPDAFEAIEQRFVDFERVDHDAASREQYEFWKSWIMDNEPRLRSTLGATRALGIGFSLLVSAYSFGLAWRLRGS